MVKNIWHDVWRVLNTDVSEFFTQDTCKDYIEAFQGFFELAETLDEKKGELEPFLGQVDSLLDVLDSPLGKVVEAGLPFLPLVTGILTFYVEKNRKEPSLEVCIALVSQGAYLESMQRFLKTHPEIHQQFNEEKVSKNLGKEIKNLGKKLELNGQEFPLDENEARKVLLCFHESNLAEAFNQLLTKRFQEAGLRETEAEIVTERISRNTHRYLKRAFVEAGDAVKKLAFVYGGDWQREEEAYLSIDDYLEEVIAKKPQEKVFDEEFSFQDVYVPLEVKSVKEDGEINEFADPESIEDWALNLLQDEGKQGQVLFIQGGPGRGKSVFCRMFADRIGREFYPIWTPILIRLRDVSTFEFNFDKTLQAAVGRDFATSDHGWLTDRNTRFLFLLDGFDELLLERGANQGLESFLDQVAKFQQQCKENKERGHRVVITGRPFALYGIQRSLRHGNLGRVAILTMSETIQRKWLSCWEKVVDADASKAKEKTEAFQAFLKEKRCPQQIKILAQEPLLLYLLSAMHRDDVLQTQMFAEDSPVDPKVLIYETAIDWVLTKQRREAGKDLNPKITGLDPEDLRSILAEAGLCVVQSGREYAAVATIEDRLTAKEDEAAKELLADAREKDEKNPLKNALAAFYLKSSPGAENCVEFFHKSFGEFLCAERMVESLTEWTQKAGKRRKTYIVSTKEMDWQVYDLFGYGALTVEVVGYLTPLLIQSQPDFVALFERLHDFYLRWSDGEFIESTEETLPQRKGRQLQKYDVERGQRQVDVYTGLNVLILLLELHRYGQSQKELKDKVTFYPCGQFDTEDFNDERLLCLIGYIDCLGVFSFASLVGKFFSYAHLSYANLS
ncbi:MAG: NACHT domain-containing protein, partial [Spirulinaceae cyanobacterium]